MSYEVSTSVFEGPFDLLLHLILKQEVDLWEISLSRIVDEYLGELERMESFDLDVTTEFLLIAATLVDLKARRLLPSLEEKIEEEGYFSCERSYGAFHRSVDLPKDVQSDKVKASFKNGILEIRLPKTEEAKTKEIKVKID